MTTAKHKIIPDTEEAWESGQLGQDADYAERLPDEADTEAMIDEALGLQPISIRLEKSLIEDFKLIASLHGLGYQPLMRQALRRFADCEKKRILQEVAAAQVRAKKKEAAAPARPAAKARKAA